MRSLLVLVALSLAGCTTVRIGRPEYYTCRQVVVYSRMDISSRKAEIIQVCKPISKEQADRFYREMR